MKIYINDEKIPFELEDEKNSYDIINAISDFAANSKPQQFLTSILINNKEYSLADEENMKKILLNKIKEIRVETRDVYGITNLSIEQIEKFLILLKEILVSRKWDDALLKIGDSISWMKEGITQIIIIFDSKETYLIEEKDNFFTNVDNLHDCINQMTPELIKNDDELANKTINIIEALEKGINEIKKMLIVSYRLPDRDYVLQSIEMLLEKIEKVIPELQNVPIYFQTGEDDKSMIIIQTLADILENSISLFILFKESFMLHMDQYTVKEVTFEEFFKTITNHLKDLMDAIKNNDSVMISDLLEYEFIPNIEEIKNILSKIMHEAFTKAN